MMSHDDNNRDNEQGLSLPTTPLINPFSRVFGRKNSNYIIGFLVFLAAFLCSFIITFFIIRTKSVRAFKSGLVKHIEKAHAELEPAKKLSYVEDLLKIHKTGKISNDAALELDMYIDFDRFVKKYGKFHQNFEKRTDRFIIFRGNHLLVNGRKGKVPYTLELNKFADMSEEEFKRLHPEIKPPKYFTPADKHVKHLKNSAQNELYLRKLKLAKELDRDIDDINAITGDNLDWRRAGVPTPVKDQGKVCGSCWAFSTVGSVEGVYSLYKDLVYDLSEQELVNCDRYSQGCNGGLPYTALEYIHNHGVSFAKDVPYEGADGFCRIKSTEKIFIDSITVAKGSDILNKSLVLSPTVVAIAVDPEMKLYSSGVYTGKCAEVLNHAVLLVGEGFDPETQKRFWVIKNSWGTDWGENGYLRLERTNEILDKCGILSFGINPVVY